MSSLADLTHADVERILGIIDKLHDIEVRIEVDGMKLHVRKFSDATRATAAMQSIATPLGDAAVAQAGAAPTGVSTAPEVQRASEALPARPGQVAPLKANSVSPSPAADDVPERESLLEVRAPMLGRFFRAPSPTEPPYVEIGSKVEPDDTVCMIEVMKLFNTVKASVRGTIVEIVVEDGQMVEHDSLLFRVRPE